MPHGPVAVVAAEHLVAAVAGEGHRHFAARHLREVHRGDGRAVGERLVVVPDQLGQNRQGVRLDDLLVVPRAEEGGRLAGVGRLVELLDGKADRERVDRLGRQLLHQARDDRRIDAAGEKRAQRHVAPHPQPHGLGQRRRAARFCQRSGDQPELAVAWPFPFELDLPAGGPSAYGGVQ